MSLPPGFLEELRSRLSLGQVVGRKVAWDARKSNPGKGDLWAPCPFHQEKTASFHVDDRKGFYYCFGCHAKGDAISFVRETENVGFAEAVEILAREAGMVMPARDPQAAEKADRRTVLAQVMEQAVQYYRLQLRAGAGAAARAYLTKRGLNEAAQDRWAIGYAPVARGGVVRHLTEKGVAPDLIVAAGLAIVPDEGGTPFDRYRDRIIFPIRDVRGRTISLGGRAMAPDASAKYINGPETDLFDKGRTLFNQGPAREAAGKGQTLIVAEGYMDVIALSEAGFGAVVAPLGTAVTEEQLRLIWRIADEPIMALDGDKAGIRAALRVVDLALPMLEAGKALRFALMPDGMDPDDLIRAQGPQAMQTVLDQAQPMVRLLWQRETEGRDFDSPERKAGLDKTLRAAIARIADPSIRAHYGEEIRALRWELFRAGRRPATTANRPRSGGRFAGSQTPSASARASRLVMADGREDQLRISVILATLIVNPVILADFADELETLDGLSSGHDTLRAALLRHAADPDLRACVQRELGEAPLENLLSERHVAISPAVARPDPDLARLCLAEELAKLRARRGHAEALAEAMEDIGGASDEWLTRRLGDAAAAVDTTRRNDTDDTRDVVIAPNGLALDRADIDHSSKVFDQIIYTKRSRGRPD